MKILFILFSLSLILGQAFGQNFSVSATDTIFYGEIDDGDFASKFILYNDSTDTFPMTWEVVSETMEAGWDYSICDPTNCHPIGATTGVFNLPTTESNRIMNIHYFPNSFFGESTVVVKLWENAYTDDFVLLEWTGIVSAVGIDNEISHNSIISYPNKEQRAINIQYDLDGSIEKSELFLYDLTGKVIDQIELNNTKGTETLGQYLETGLYVYALISNGEVIVSKKVVVE